MALDSVHYGVGIGFMVLNMLGQWFFTGTAKETILIVIGNFIHLIASGLLGFALIMLVQTVLAPRSAPPGRASAQSVDLDMVIAYSLFGFTGFALTNVAVFLRSGSFYFNIFTVLLGLAGAFLADPSIRSKVRATVPKAVSGAEDADTWSATPSQSTNYNRATGGANLRYRY